MECQRVDASTSTSQVQLHYAKDDDNQSLPWSSYPYYLNLCIINCRNWDHDGAAVQK